MRDFIFKGVAHILFPWRDLEHPGRNVRENEEFFIAFVIRKRTRVHRSLEFFLRQLKIEQLESKLLGMFSDILLLLLTFYFFLFSGCF